MRLDFHVDYVVVHLYAHVLGLNHSRGNSHIFLQGLHKFDSDGVFVRINFGISHRKRDFVGHERHDSFHNIVFHAVGKYAAVNRLGRRQKMQNKVVVAHAVLCANEPDERIFIVRKFFEFNVKFFHFVPYILQSMRLFHQKSTNCRLFL